MPWNEGKSAAIEDPWHNGLGRRGWSSDAGTGPISPALRVLARVAWLWLRRDAEAFESIGLQQSRAG